MAKRYYYLCKECNKAGLEDRSICPRCGAEVSVTSY